MGAVFLGVLYYHLSLSGIAAVQNRMGIFMLECVFLGFTSVSALPVSYFHYYIIDIHVIHTRRERMIDVRQPT
jgi:hypothetical protein